MRINPVSEWYRVHRFFSADDELALAGRCGTYTHTRFYTPCVEGLWCMLCLIPLCLIPLCWVG